MTRPAPTVTDRLSVLVSVPGAVIEACKGEQEHFENWAKSSRYDMSEHPLHYIFLDPKTDAARMGWNAALAYVRKAAAPAAPQAAGVGEDKVRRLEAIARGYGSGWIVQDFDHGRMTGDDILELIEALRAPSREPEGGAVSRIAELEFELRAKTYTVEICEEQIERLNARIAALATREEAPAEAGEDELKAIARIIFPENERVKMDREWGGNRSHSRARWNRAIGQAREILALRAQPQAREDATVSPLGGASVGPDEAEEASFVDATPQVAQRDTLGTQPHSGEDQ